jgi:hypothetical protein
MGRGPADEAVVIVKPGADDPVVTQVRIKHRGSGREPEVKGGTRKRSMRLIKDCGSEISLRGAVGGAMIDERFMRKHE